MAKQISELNWQKRLLIISYQNDGDQIFKKTTKFISDNKCEIEDRNLQIVFFEKFKNKNYIIPKFIKSKYGLFLMVFFSLFPGRNGARSALCKTICKMAAFSACCQGAALAG